MQLWQIKLHESTAASLARALCTRKLRFWGWATMASCLISPHSLHYMMQLLVSGRSVPEETAAPGWPALSLSAAVMPAAPHAGRAGAPAGAAAAGLGAAGPVARGAAGTTRGPLLAAAAAGGGFTLYACATSLPRCLCSGVVPGTTMSSL